MNNRTSLPTCRTFAHSCSTSSHALAKVVGLPENTRSSENKVDHKGLPGLHHANNLTSLAIQPCLTWNDTNMFVLFAWWWWERIRIPKNVHRSKNLKGYTKHALPLELKDMDCSAFVITILCWICLIPKAFHKVGCIVVNQLFCLQRSLF